MVLAQVKWILRAAFRSLLIVSIATAASLPVRGEDKEKGPRPDRQPGCRQRPEFLFG